MNLLFVNRRNAVAARAVIALGAVLGLTAFLSPVQAQIPAPPIPPAAPAPTPRPPEDWPNLGRFHHDDAQIKTPALGEDRVVFMGDSITDFWPLDRAFPGKPYLNRGISGQTTPQMLLRFRQDVVALRPRAVVILGGTNDIAGNTGPMTPEMTEDNLMSMTDLAKANGIRVVLASILPAYDFPWHPGLQPSGKILALNTWIKDYAARKHYVYLDYYSAMVDSRPGLKAELTGDGVHPNAAGYAVMAPLAQKAIQQALH